MNIDLTTPAIFFPAISLLLLAYNNRFLAVASLIRSLHNQYLQNPESRTYGQIKNLRMRLQVIRNMQAFGISGMLGCVCCIFVLYLGFLLAGKILFVISLLLLLVSLIFSLQEILISVNALNIQLGDLEEREEILQAKTYKIDLNRK